jgi:predicted HTH transcriptional regulator
MANNRAGGITIFGVEDATRAIVGIRNPSLTNDVVLRAARMIKPAVPLCETSVQIWTLDGCTLLTVEIPSNSGRLYQYDGACYVRRGTNTVPLSVEEIGAYLNAYGVSRWELTLTQNARSRISTLRPSSDTSTTGRRKVSGGGAGSLVFLFLIENVRPSASAT